MTNLDRINKSLIPALISLESTIEEYQAAVKSFRDVWVLLRTTTNIVRDLYDMEHYGMVLRNYTLADTDEVSEQSITMSGTVFPVTVVRKAYEDKVVGAMFALHKLWTTFPNNATEVLKIPKHRSLSPAVKSKMLTNRTAIFNHLLVIWGVLSKYEDMIPSIEKFLHATN